MAMTVRYTTINGEVIAEKRNGVRKLYVPDPLGSTVALLDNTQTQTDTFTYWPYGEVRTRTGTTATPFQYVGTLGYYSDATGRTYDRARYLHNAKARWLTPDMNPGDGPNGYLYAKVNPVTYFDADGNASMTHSSQPKCNCSSVLKQAKNLLNMNCGNDDLSKGMACIDVWGTATLKAGCGFEDVSTPCRKCGRTGVSHVHSIQAVCSELKSSGHWQSPCDLSSIKPGCLITFSIAGEPDQGCGAHSAVVSDNGKVIMCSSTCPGASPQQPKICERTIADWRLSLPRSTAIKGCGCFCKKGK